jgi:hypothetical protein
MFTLVDEAVNSNFIVLTLIGESNSNRASYREGVQSIFNLRLNDTFV